MDKVQRINITVLSSQDYELVQLLSDLSDVTLSSGVGLALHEWLKDNFVKDIERHAKVEHLLNETGIPNHRHGYTEEA